MGTELFSNVNKYTTQPYFYYVFHPNSNNKCQTMGTYLSQLKWLQPTNSRHLCRPHTHIFQHVSAVCFVSSDLQMCPTDRNTHTLLSSINRDFKAAVRCASCLQCSPESASVSVDTPLGSGNENVAELHS